MDELVTNSPPSHKVELIKKLNSMKGNYPMSQEALLWMQGFVCSHNERLFHVYDHFPSFDNGWDSAIEEMIQFVKNMPDF